MGHLEDTGFDECNILSTSNMLWISLERSGFGEMQQWLIFQEAEVLCLFGSRRPGMFRVHRDYREAGEPPFVFFIDNSGTVDSIFFGC